MPIRYIKKRTIMQTRGENFRDYFKDISADPDKGMAICKSFGASLLCGLGLCREDVSRILPLIEKWLEHEYWSTDFVYSLDDGGDVPVLFPLDFNLAAQCLSERAKDGTVIECKELPAYDGLSPIGATVRHQHVLFIALSAAVALTPRIVRVWRSMLFSDGRRLPGMFIAGIVSAAGQHVVYYLPLDLWERCSFMEILGRAPEGDAHTTLDAFDCLYKLIDELT